MTQDSGDNQKIYKTRSYNWYKYMCTLVVPMTFAGMTRQLRNFDYSITKLIMFSVVIILAVYIVLIPVAQLLKQEILITEEGITYTFFWIKCYYQFSDIAECYYRDFDKCLIFYLNDGSEKNMSLRNFDEKTDICNSITKHKTVKIVT